MTMPAPAKPKKTRRNQPVEFHESLAAAPTLPLGLPEAPSLPLSNRQFKNLLTVVWAAAVIAGGIGIGLLILSRTRVPAVTQLPVPVATGTLSVAPLSAQPAISVEPASAAAGTLPVVSPDGAGQSSTNPQAATLSQSLYQAGAGSDALQPGFAHYGSPQGSRGTDPVY